MRPRHKAAEVAAARARIFTEPRGFNEAAA